MIQETPEDGILLEGAGIRDTASDYVVRASIPNQPILSHT